LPMGVAHKYKTPAIVLVPMRGCRIDNSPS